MTQPFHNPARLNATAMGVPDLPFVVLPHPVGHLPPETVKELARAAYPGIVAALTEPLTGWSDYLVDLDPSPEEPVVGEGTCDVCVE